MGSSVEIYKSSFKIIGSGIQNLFLVGDTHADTRTDNKTTF
jgi:hypothetical protein